MKKTFFLVWACGALLLASCSVPRKCNGTPGKRVPMGVM